MTIDELEKLRVEILSKDLEVYRTLETWGSSLFLGAIAIVAKELVDWSRPTESAVAVTFASWVYGVPFAIGAVAFAFLRAVNFRGRRAVRARETIVGSLPFPRRPWGVLGALFALMPLALGGAATLAVGSMVGVHHNVAPTVWTVSLLVICIAIVIHVRER